MALSLHSQIYLYRIASVFGYTNSEDNDGVMN